MSVRAINKSENTNQYQRRASYISYTPHQPAGPEVEFCTFLELFVSASFDFFQDSSLCAFFLHSLLKYSSKFVFHGYLRYVWVYTLSVRSCLIPSAHLIICVLFAHSQTFQYDSHVLFFAVLLLIREIFIAADCKQISIFNWCNRLFQERYLNARIFHFYLYI